MITRYSCPIRSCIWVHETPRDLTGPLFTVEAVLATEQVIRAHMESHPLEEWAREVTELRMALDANRA